MKRGFTTWKVSFNSSSLFESNYTNGRRSFDAFSAGGSQQRWTPTWCHLIHTLHRNWVWFPQIPEERKRWRDPTAGSNRLRVWSHREHFPRWSWICPGDTDNRNGDWTRHFPREDLPRLKWQLLRQKCWRGEYRLISKSFIIVNSQRARKDNSSEWQEAKVVACLPGLGSPQNGEV